MKTIDEIIKAKTELESDILELLNDFQSVSGCQVKRVEFIFSSEIGKRIDPIVQLHVEVHLPRAK